MADKRDPSSGPSPRDQLLPSRGAPCPQYGATTLGDDTKLHLQRALSARQVQMIALAGTIGTGLFLGTGKSLAEGTPSSCEIGLPPTFYQAVPRVF
jgi:hypothetical protein